MSPTARTLLLVLSACHVGLQPAGAQLNVANLTTLTSIEAFGSMSSNDSLGQAMAVGDFDMNGWDDLVLGAPGWRVGGEFPGGGGVAVFYGAAEGLQSPAGQIWSQNSPGIDDVVESRDGFGTALATGDFDRDGYDDLAISAPFEDLELCLPICVVTEDYGVVHVLYGSSSGLTSSGAQFLRQSAGGLPGDFEEDDRLGSSLAAGDFDFDGYFDLAIGVPFESLETGSTIECGAINVIYGSDSGLDTGRTLFWHQDTTGLDDVASTGDHWGAVLAVGNFRGLVDPAKPIDLVVGSPDDDQGSTAPSDEVRKGSVQILQGGALGLVTTNDIYLSLDQPAIPGAPERDANFGYALTVGDFDGSGFDDLAISAPNKDGGGIEDSGLVYVIESAGAAGLVLTGIQFWGQDFAGVAEAAEVDDSFGQALLAADLNADGYDELVVGVPLEDEGPSLLGVGSGVVHVLNGSPTGIVADGDELFHQEQLGEIRDVNEQLGYALAAGSFDRGGPTLAIAAPFEEIRIPPVTHPQPGIVHLIGQALFTDGFESGDVTRWSSGTP
ncbi:MAG: hypothetical protein GY719_38505 [bacterium]|nr:hypothetical protein [bacterium]